MPTADVVIIGGGVIGLSVAEHLVRRAPLSVIVLEREADLGSGATARASGGIRHQFTTETNIRLTQLSYPEFVDFEARVGQAIGFHQHGYLFIASTSSTAEALADAVALQQSMGVPSRLIDADELGRIFPQVRTDDVEGASYCGIDGSANPADVVLGYKRAAERRGVRFLRGERAIGIELVGGRVTKVVTDRDSYATSRVVNAAGPFAREIAALVDVDLPAYPFRRQTFIVDPIPAVPRVIPLTIDLDSGWNIHQERSGVLLVGGTDKDTRPGTEPVVDWGGFDRVAAAAIHRVPTLAEQMHVRGAYAGIRTLTPDYHGILGPVDGVEGFLCATNCNGHGFMHAPAVGQLLAEAIVDGRMSSLNGDRLALSRFRAGELQVERAVN